MLDFETMLLILLAILGLGIGGMIFRPVIVGLIRSRRALRDGELATARVIDISQTGGAVNRMPVMRMVLDVEHGGGEPRRVEIQQAVDLGAMPRVNDRIYVSIDRTDPDNVVMVRLAPMLDDDAIPVDFASEETRDVFSLVERLREHGEVGVARVLAIAPTSTTASSVTLEIDRIGAPRYHATTMQMLDQSRIAVGDRVYILVDPEDPNCVALVPQSMTGGSVIDPGTHRLDAVVLGPQLLAKGAKATGTVKSASEQHITNPAIAKAGGSKWCLDLDVQPDSPEVPAYQFTLVITLTTREKAERVAHAGAVVPLRYDPLDPQTLSMDSIAMGYGDPYAEMRASIQRARKI